MIRKIMAIVVAAYMIIGGIIALTPRNVIAKNKPIYMAGIKSGDICNCPVTAGDCVCAIWIRERNGY